MNCKLVSFRFCCLNSSNDIISYPATLAERQLRKTHKVDQNEAFYYKDVSHSYCNPIQLKIYTVVVASSSRPKSTILHGPNICDTSFSAKSVVPLQNLSHSTFPHHSMQCVLPQQVQSDCSTVNIVWEEEFVWKYCQFCVANGLDEDCKFIITNYNGQSCGIQSYL